MRTEAIFINGVHEKTLVEILEFQKELQELIMFLQPYSGKVIRLLCDSLPSADNPVQLLISVTTKPSEVKYAAQIVGWENKGELKPERRHVLNRLIWTLQPREGGLYDHSRSAEGQSVNLLHVRRVRELTKPFSVTQLTNVNDGNALSDQRYSSGSWQYVRADEALELIQAAQ